MNKQRRKQIAKIVATLSELKDLKDIGKYCNILDSVDKPLQDIIDEEQEALDNMPENLFFSQRYSDMEDGLMDLEGAQTDLALASECILERGKFHGSDTKMERQAIITLKQIAK